MKTSELHDLQQRLAQAQAECACWACTGEAGRLQETRFVVAMLTLRIRHRQHAAVPQAAPAGARTCHRLDLHEPACTHSAAAPAA